MNGIDLTKEAFNTKQVCEIMQTSPRKVRYWDAKGLVKPSIRPANGRGSQRLYSYADLLAIQTIKSLRDQGISLQKIRKSILYLRRHLPDISRPLNFCTLISDGETVYLVEDEKTLIDTIRLQGQRVFFQLSIAAIDRELRKKVIQISTKRIQNIAVGDYTYQIEIEPDTECGGYVAEVAGLPGCITQGDTLKEILEMAEDAIEAYLEAVEDLKERGVDLPIKRQRRARKARA